MSQRILFLLSVFLTVQGTIFAAKAQPAPATPEATTRGQVEMANLNRSLQELVALLREYVGRQQTDLLLKRVELGLLKMGPLNQEKRDLRTRNAGDDEELKRLQAALAASQATEPHDTTKPEYRDEAAQIIMVEANVKRLKNRISETDQRLAELDSELRQEERNLQRWEALIDQRLGQR